jgi:hypothetical protein
MPIPNELPNRRDQLLAMIQELQTNRIILDELVDCYSMFRFTGGVVPREQWGLVAIASYLRRPSADCIFTAAAERYRQVAEAIMDQVRAMTAEAGPRTLRCRHALAEAFGRESSEIRALGSTLESAMTKTIEELDPLPLLLEMKSVKSDSSPNGVSAITTGVSQ